MTTVDPCTAEVGLLRKKPCGQPSVAKCANCEQPLCGKHAIAQVSAAGRKTGTFLCAQCNAAAKLYEETAPAPAATPVAKAPAPKAKPVEAPKPDTPAPAAPAAKAPAPEKKSGPSPDDSGMLEFTPEPKKPDGKK